jgi:hypothetical protein
VTRRWLAHVASAVIVLVGVAGAVLVAVRGRSSGTPAAGASASVAAPTFGASLPVTAPSAHDSTGSAAFTDPATVATVLADVKTAVQTVESFDYRHLDTARAAGDKVSAGGFLGRYNTSLTGSAATSARASHTIQSATVEKAGICSVSGSRATALVVGRVQVTDDNDPAGVTQPITLGVTLQKTDAWRITDLGDVSTTARFPATPPGDAGLGAAVLAAGHEVVDLLSYTRNNFAADLARALGGLTSTLAAGQRSGAAALRAAMVSGGYDYAGLVRSIGVESASGSSVLLLVCATGYQVGNTGGSISSGPVRYEVGVQFIGGRWLVSEYQSLDSS